MTNQSCSLFERQDAPRPPPPPSPPPCLSRSSRDTSSICVAVALSSHNEKGKVGDPASVLPYLQPIITSFNLGRSRGGVLSSNFAYMPPPFPPRAPRHFHPHISYRLEAARQEKKEGRIDTLSHTVLSEREDSCARSITCAELNPLGAADQYGWMGIGKL